MSSKPKKSEYKASAAERTEARISAQKAEFFNANYQPLNVAELKDSLTDDIKNIARGRGNADTMQALTSKTSYADTQAGGEVAASLSSGYQGQMGRATSAAKDIQNKRSASAIGVAQGQSADASKAQSALTQIGTGRQLDNAKNKQLLREARQSAGMKVAGAGAEKTFGEKEWFQNAKGAFDRAEGRVKS